MCFSKNKQKIAATTWFVCLQSPEERQETHRMLVGVAGEVDLCGSLVNPMTRLSIGVVQDELVPHITQKLVCHSCHRATHISDKCKNKTRMRLFRWFQRLCTSDLLLVCLHLAGGDRFTAGAVGADGSLEPPADRQVVDVLIVPDLVVSTLQRAQVELVAAPGVVDPTVIA